MTGMGIAWKVSAGSDEDNNYTETRLFVTAPIWTTCGYTWASNTTTADRTPAYAASAIEGMSHGPHPANGNMDSAPADTNRLVLGGKRALFHRPWDIGVFSVVIDTRRWLDL